MVTENGLNEGDVNYADNSGLMKILTLNVCGLNKRLSDPEFINLLELYDLVLLMESKTDDTDIDYIKEKVKEIGMKCYFHNRFKLRRPRSGGIIVLYKDFVDSCVRELETESKYVKWFKVNMKSGINQEEVLFGAVYIPPESSVYSSINSYDEVENELLSVCNDNKYVFLAGDFNAHTGSKADYVVLDGNIGMGNDSDNEEADHVNIVDHLRELGIPSQRVSCDKHKVDNFGNRLLDMCISSQLVICNGRLGLDAKVGQCTTTTESVIDYNICSLALMKDIVHFEVLDFNELYSDIHCGVSAHIKMSKPVTKEPFNTKDTGQCNSEKYLVWDDTKQEIFMQNLSESDIENVLDRISSDVDVNIVCDDINNIFVNSARKCNLLINHKSKVSKPGVAGFDRECRESRKIYHKHKNKFHRNRCQENNTAMKNSRNKYKVILRKAVAKHKKSVQKKIRNLRSNNSKDFWRLINKREKDKITIPLAELKSHFEKVSSCTDNSTELKFDKLPINAPNALLDKCFTEEEILAGIKQLKNGKSKGVDDIYNEYIKYSIKKFLPVWVNLFNRILNDGKFHAIG